MARNRSNRKPVSVAPSPLWDHGQATLAQRGPVPLPNGGRDFRAVVEEAGEVDPATGKKQNPNGVTRARKRSVAEIYHGRGYLTADQANVADVLLSAYLAAQASGGRAIGIIRVDTSFGRDDAMVARMTAVARWCRLEALIPDAYAREVLHVCRDDLPITTLRGYARGRSMERLQAGLDLLAAALR